MDDTKEQSLNFKNWPEFVKIVNRLATSKDVKLSEKEMKILDMLDKDKIPACNIECLDFQRRRLSCDFDTRLIAYLTTNPIFPKEDRALLLDVVMKYDPAQEAPLEKLSVHVLKEFRNALTRPYMGLKEKVDSLTNEIEKKEAYLADLLREVDHLMQEILQESAGKIMKSESVVIKAFDQALPNEQIIDIIKSQNRQIIQYIREESVKASLDPLTGVYNRGALDRHLAQAFTECKAENIPLSVLMIDVDFFKRFNDTYGHLVGDEALKFVVQTGILKRVKGFESAFCGRYGGEEFVVVLRGIKLRQADSIAETIRSSLDLIEFVHERSDIDDPALNRQIKEKITISIGVSEMQEDQHDPMELIAKADKALYEAKSNGRNKVRSL